MPDAPNPPAAASRPRTEVTVPHGARAVVVSDLHLGTDPSGDDLVGELITALRSWAGPGVLVLNGNTVDGNTVDAGDLDDLLTHHAPLVATISSWAAAPARRVVVVPGDRDAHIGWSEAGRAVLARRLSAEVVPAVDLLLETGEGTERVRVDSGDGTDRPVGAAPGLAPLAEHLRAEVIPRVTAAPAGRRGARDDWLDGIDRLDDPGSFPRFIASRLTYRTLGRRAWLLALPVAVALAFRVPSLLLTQASGLADDRPTRVVILAVTLVVEAVLLAGIGLGALRRTWRALSGISGSSALEPNRPGRDQARRLISEGYRGLVSGRTSRPELADLGTGFFANAGCIAGVVTEYPARLPGLGLPPLYLSRRQVSWIEIEAGAEVHVRLLLARRDACGATVVERLALRRGAIPPAGSGDRPHLVASWPGGDSWPPRPSGQLRKRRIRRLAGVVVAIAGFVSLVASLSEPLRDRLGDVRRVVPIVVPETADALTALAGVALLVLARGIRRGQRRAWRVALILLLVTAGLRIVKGVDIEEAVVALAIAAFLWVNRAEFEAASDRTPLRGGLLRWAAITAITVAAGTISIELSVAYVTIKHRLTHHRNRGIFHISWPRALQATLERMVGISRVRLPHTLSEFFGPAMTTASLGLALFLLVLLFRPVAARRRQQPGAGGLEQARAVVDRFGSGTLDYFALRPDKQFFFWGDTVVAHAVYGGVCLVSPDPVGPPTEREPAWRAFRSYVDDNGWALGGLGAGEDWLPIYRATGMHDLYVGDEGVVRIGRFTLEGGRFKGLRQAVNRVAKYGYTITFHDPAALEPELREELLEVMTKSRRGDVERGFSMTLGRVFEPGDHGLLLAVVHGPPDAETPDRPGAPVAFCQYVPAPGIGGYSLDLMRRDAGEHPNGLIDFAVVETIRHLAAEGCAGLGLNFATMRAVLAGESGDGPTQKVQAWLLRRMGDSMQIESLWRFNAKFDPDWQPRYAIYDAPENAVAVALAIARAESFWELPVIGRFLVPEGAAPGS